MATSMQSASFDTQVQPACTLTNVANATGRISAQIDNTTARAPMGWVTFQAMTGGVAAPTVNSLVKLYLIRSSTGTVAYQGGQNGMVLGTADASVATEPVNSPLAGSFVVTSTSSMTYTDVFPIYDPGPKFSFVVWNASGVSLANPSPVSAIIWQPGFIQAQ